MYDIQVSCGTAKLILAIAFVVPEQSLGNRALRCDVLKQLYPYPVKYYIHALFFAIFLILFLLLQNYEYSSEDLEDYGEIGRGAYGTVNKMLHKESKTYMAVKVLVISINRNNSDRLFYD